MVVTSSDLSVVLLSDLFDHLTSFQLSHLGEPSRWADCPDDPGCTTRAACAVSLVRSVWKKYQDEIDKEKADAEAFRLFNEANEFCALDGKTVIDLNQFGPCDSEILGQIKAELWDFFNPKGFSLFTGPEDELIPPFLELGDFGPGAAPGAEFTSFLHKLGMSKLGATDRQVIGDFYDWCDRDIVRSNSELCRALSVGRPVIEEPTSLTSVPKTSKVSRLVKTEPLLNMFFQKGIQKVLEQRLSSFWGIDLATQPSTNSELARLGSISGEFATVDLKQCSDYISVALVKELLDPLTFWVFDRYRSPLANVEGRVVRLNMMATMGNAFCFPLQTIILAAVVRATYKCLGKKLRRPRYRYELVNGSILSRFIPPNWGVFGDDIVVETDAYPTLIRVLKALRLVPNESKSFWFGDFRESCGTDWKSGENVRGVYIKTLKTPQNQAVAFNSLVEWSVRTGVKLTHTLAFLYSARQDWYHVPLWENPDAGIRMPFDLVPSDQIRRVSDLQGSILYRKWLGKPKSFDRTKGYKNPLALLIAASDGLLRGGLETVRPKILRYGNAYGVAPNWDTVPGDSYVVRRVREDLLSWVVGIQSELK